MVFTDHAVEPNPSSRQKDSVVAKEVKKKFQSNSLFMGSPAAGI
jgi:hypothetical protein